MTIQKPDFNKIFASQAPDADKPPAFNNYNGGWGSESRSNNGKPTIRGFNYLQQFADTKLLWLKQNAILPYDSDTDYPVGTVTLKDGKFQKLDGVEWADFIKLEDTKITTWSGRTQEAENKDFVSSVHDYSDLGDIAAAEGRAVEVKQGGKAGVFAYNPNSTKTPDGGTVIKDSQGRIWERVFKGHPIISWFEPVADGVTDNTAKFTAANAVTGITYIPAGNYKTNLVVGAKYYGEGKLLVAFGAANYDFYCTAVPQIIPTGILTYDDGSKEINTTIYLGSNSGRSAKTNESMVVAFGGRALESSGTGANVTARATAIGAHAARRASAPFSATAIGDSALENGKFYQRIVAIGSNALQFAGDNTPLADRHEFLLQADPYGLVTKNSQFRSFVGTSATPLNLPVSAEDAKESVAVGRNALLHNVKSIGDTAVGYNALAHGWSTNGNTAVGHSALRDGVASVGNTAAGASAGLSLQTGTANVAIGREAFQAAVHLQSCTAVGFQAMSSLSGNSPDQTEARNAARQNTAIGAYAMQNSTAGVNIVAVGNAAFQNAEGSQSVAVGVAAGSTLTTATNTTLVGYNAGTKTLGGSPTVSLTNSAALGYDAPLSGDNQVQLGNSATTTYVYGTVQNRSDARDKADIKPLDSKMTDFILGLNAVQGVWDMRDDYVSELPDDWTDEQRLEWWSNPTKDGCKKRSRKHNWFIAQEVKVLADKLGIDFAGLQDHKLIDGTDTLTIGYDEFIPPVVATIQKLNKRLDDIESRLSKLE